MNDAKNPRKLWANLSWLNHLGLTLEEFQTNDPNSESLALTSEAIARLGREVQRDRRVVSHSHVMRVKGLPQRLVGVFRPVLFEGMAALTICTYVPPTTDEPESGCSAAQQSALEYNEQVWTVVELRAIIFDASDGLFCGRALWANVAARSSFSTPFLHSSIRPFRALPVLSFLLNLSFPGSFARASSS